MIGVRLSASMIVKWQVRCVMSASNGTWHGVIEQLLAFTNTRLEKRSSLSRMYEHAERVRTWRGVE